MTEQKRMPTTAATNGEQQNNNTTTIISQYLENRKAAGEKIDAQTMRLFEDVSIIEEAAYHRGFRSGREEYISREFDLLGTSVKADRLYSLVQTLQESYFDDSAEEARQIEHLRNWGLSSYGVLQNLIGIVGDYVFDIRKDLLSFQGAQE